MDPLVIRTDDEAIATVKLNRPKALNALSDELIAQLQGTLDALAVDRTIRVIILKGAGKAFCAGHDLREMTAARQAEDGGAAYFQDLFARCSHLMSTLPRLPQPVIAQVQGIATAAGCQMVAHCDIAVASDDAQFGVNGVNIGLFCSTPMVALSRNIPRKQAFEMLTTGDFASARRAVELGLINRAVPVADLESETAALARQIAGKFGGAVALGKEAYYQQLEMGLSDAYAYTGQVMAQNMLMPETAEGIDAFLTKRDPEWTQ
ncbi:MAG: enoyl-CoA hydratase [Pseudomonadota bacterium]